MREAPFRVVIVGGGFGGVAAALAFEQYAAKNIEVTLVSDTTHFEYHAALYRVVTGRSPLEVCIPLSEILNNKKTVIVKDRVEKINLVKKTVYGREGSMYQYDYLIFGIGSRTTFFDIPGMKENTFTLKSINDALRLKNHIHELFTAESKNKSKKPINIVIAGGGSTGVELSGELAVYTRKLAKMHALSPSQITIDVFEASSRLLPNLRLNSSNVAQERLHSLGVNVFLNSPILKKDIDNVYLEHMKMRSKTVIWTIGNTANELVEKTGFTVDRRGRIEVKTTLQSKDSESAFVIGDAASTKYSGMAQTASRDGNFAAVQIIRAINNQPLADYIPVAPFHSIPIGPGWALLESQNRSLTGSLGYSFRRFVDFTYFHSILPFSAAIRAFQDGRKIYETCPQCSSLDVNSGDD